MAQDDQKPNVRYATGSPTSWKEGRIIEGTSQDHFGLSGGYTTADVRDENGDVRKGVTVIPAKK